MRGASGRGVGRKEMVSTRGGGRDQQKWKLLCRLTGEKPFAVGSLAIVPPVPMTKTFLFFPYTILCWVWMLEPVWDGVSGAMGVEGNDIA